MRSVAAGARIAGPSAGVADGAGEGTSVRPKHLFAVSGTASELQPFGCPAGD